jgi:hypothetical protein
MEIIRQQNMNINEFYWLTEWKELAPFFNTEYTPIYSTIPKEMGGKMVEK